MQANAQVKHQIFFEFKMELESAVQSSLFVNNPDKFRDIALQTVTRETQRGSGSSSNGNSSSLEQTRTLLERVVNSIHAKVLTSTHTLYLRVLLEQRMFQVAKNVCDTLFSSIESHMPVQDVLAFYHYASLVYIKLDSFTQAQSSIYHVLAVPASHAISIFQLKALRNLFLIQLIQEGRIFSLPSWISKRSPQVHRWWENVIKQSEEMGDLTEELRMNYMNADSRGEFEMTDLQLIAKAYHSDHLVEIVTQLAPLLQKRKQMGLACKVITAMQHSRIEKMAKMYSSVPVEECMHRMGNIGDSKDLFGILESLNLSLRSRGCFVCKLDETGQYVLFEKSDTVNSIIDLGDVSTLLEGFTRIDAEMISKLRRNRLA